MASQAVCRTWEGGGLEPWPVPGSGEVATPPRLGSWNLLIGGAGFVLLTIGIFWFQFHRIPQGAAGPRWTELRWGYLALLLLWLPVETLACGLRMWVVCRVLEPGVGLWTCVKAEWANVAISALTPSQSGGGPGQIYILTRGGARVGTALTISLLSFVGTMVGLTAMGLYSLLVSGVAAAGALVTAAVLCLIAISALMGLAAVAPGLLRVPLAAASRAFCRVAGGRVPLTDWWPPLVPRTGAPVERVDLVTGRLLDLIHTYRDDVARFVRRGKRSFAWVCLLSLVFLLARCVMPYLCLRFLGVETASLRQVVEAQMALVFLVFFAPTPGGAGMAEGASLSIMAEIVLRAFAPYYNLLWRFSTVYLAALAGLVTLSRALVGDARRLRSSLREGRQ